MAYRELIKDFSGIRGILWDHPSLASMPGKSAAS